MFLLQKSPDTHRFSKHDNRHSFPTDASYFDTVSDISLRPSLSKKLSPKTLSILQITTLLCVPYKTDNSFVNSDKLFILFGKRILVNAVGI